MRRFGANFCHHCRSGTSVFPFFANPEEELMKTAASLSLAVSALMMAAPAAAQFAKTEDAIKYRQGAMFVMNQHVGRIGAMVNGRVPYDAKAALAHAEIVEVMSKLPWAAFGPGTDKGLPTKAKAEIWTEQAKFKEHSEKLVGETGKLLAAAKTNSLDNLKVAFGSTANTCKACHDAYRSD
jgi:cytochrome c556